MPPACFCRCLQGADLQLCRERRQLVQRVKQLESAVAGMLGLAMVYTHQSMLLAPEYRSVLEALAAAALDIEPGGALWRQETHPLLSCAALLASPCACKADSTSLCLQWVKDAACDRSMSRDGGCCSGISRLCHCCTSAFMDVQFRLVIRLLVRHKQHAAKMIDLPSTPKQAL